MPRNGHQLGKRTWQSTLQSVGTLAITTPFAAVMTLILWRAFLYQKVGSVLSVGIACLVLVVLSAVFYACWMWLFFWHPDEIRKRIPISSKELRRRKKAFYDWLASQGRGSTTRRVS